MSKSVLHNSFKLSACARSFITAIRGFIVIRLICVLVFRKYSLWQRMLTSTSWGVLYWMSKDRAVNTGLLNAYCSNASEKTTIGVYLKQPLYVTRSYV